MHFKQQWYYWEHDSLNSESLKFLLMLRWVLLSRVAIHLFGALVNSCRSHAVWHRFAKNRMRCESFDSFSTQYFLRRKVLEGDMSRYVCCQGYTNICCFQAGTLGEQYCPDVCLCCESCCCNGFAISASRMYMMDRYQLASDPCDYRLIRINNCIQILSCFCNILAVIDEKFQHLAGIIDRIADFFYHLVSGCMTAQARLVFILQHSRHWPYSSFFPGIFRNGLSTGSKDRKCGKPSVFCHSSSWDQVIRAVNARWADVSFEICRLCFILNNWPLWYYRTDTWWVD